VVGPTTTHLQERSAYLRQRLETAFGSDVLGLSGFLRANGIHGADDLDDILSSTRGAGLAEGWHEELRRIARADGMQAAPEDPWDEQLDSLLFPLLQHSRSNVVKRVTRQGDRKEREWKRDACHVVMRQTPQRMRALVTGPLVLQMNSLERDLPQGRDGYTAAINRFAANPADWLALMAGYPVMTRLLLTSAERWVKTSAELVNRLYNDRAALCRWLGIETLTLTAARPDLGDPHATGTVTELIAHEEVTFYYKPRSSAIAEGFVKLAQHLDQLDQRWKIGDFLPETLSRGEYGWTKPVTAKVFENEVQLARYFERLGYFGGIAWVLNSVDLHCFNVVPSEQGPVLLDFETLLTPSGLTQSRNPPSPLEGAASGTGILPTLSGVGGALTGTDFSAFGSIAGETPFTERFWEDAGTTSMRLSERRGRLAPLSQPMSTTGPVDPHRFHSPFLKGFRSMLEFLHERRAAILEAASGIAELRDVPIRVLLRPTAEYSRFLADSLHPGYLSDQILRQIHFSWLWRNRGEGVSDGVVAAELNALLLDDVIPYAWTYANSRDLFIGQGKAESDFFRRTAWEVFCDRLRSLDGPGITRLEWSAQAALAAGALERSSDAVGSCCAQPAARTADRAAPVEAAAAILRRIADLSFGSGEPRTWLDLWSNNGKLWRLDVIDDSLYRGHAGMYLAFDAAAGFFAGRRDLARMLRGISDGLWLALARTVASPATSLVGAYEGLGGYLYAVTQSYGRRREAVQAMDALLAALEAADHEGEADVSRGAAGAILCLIAASKRLAEAQSRKALQVARAYGDVLLDVSHFDQGLRRWHTVDGVAVAGYAHGSSGITLALRRLAESIEGSDGMAASRFLEAAREGERWERAQFDERARNWVDLRPTPDEPGPQFSAGWCNGSAGIGISRLQALRLRSTDERTSDYFRHDLDSALQSSRLGLGRGQSLCHGDMGIALLYFEAGRYLGQRQHIDYARRIGTMVALDVLEHEGAVKSGVRHLRDTPALMNGGAGVALGLLRLVSPEDVPDPLAIGN
jgi:type 2 lantibiotic biosynthesis protein LanM